MEEFKKELLELGFNVNSIGFMYWLDIYMLVKENKYGKRTMNYYIEIAEKNKTTYTAVERCLRRSMQPAIENIKNKYSYYENITNCTFMNLIRINFYEK